MARSLKCRTVRSQLLWNLKQRPGYRRKIAIIRFVARQWDMRTDIPSQDLAAQNLSDAVERYDPDAPCAAEPSGPTIMAQKRWERLP